MRGEQTLGVCVYVCEREVHKSIQNEASRRKITKVQSTSSSNDSSVLEQKGLIKFEINKKD